jgi:hypothetical protein
LGKPGGREWERKDFSLRWQFFHAAGFGNAFGLKA